MRTPTSKGWRLLRAGIFAVVATQLAALGHLLAGGALPNPAVLLTLTVFLGGSLSGFAGRRRSGPQIFGALLASQLVFHLALTLTAHPMEGHPMAAQAGGSGGAERMIAFHIVAAVVASWVMASGESTMFRLFSALHRVLRLAPTKATIDASPAWTALIPTGTVGVRPSAADLSTASRRGPPPATRLLTV